MAGIELKRFTKPGVLMRIESQHLVRFLERFKEELKEKKCCVPPARPGSEGYCTGWAETLKAPEKLPEGLVEALMAMEEQVAPENWPRLSAAVFNARHAKLWLDTAC